MVDDFSRIPRILTQITRVPSAKAEVRSSASQSSKKANKLL
jgi:hypothetical protein